jgi:gas vesicle protein
MYHHSNQNGLFLLGALAGGIVATLTTLLFTTKKGEQIKNMIVEKCHSLEDGLSHTQETVERSAKDACNAIEKSIPKIQRDSNG